MWSDGGYNRYWLAEHHNMPGIASAATAVVIGHVAGGTSTIRLGAGGIMLPVFAADTEEEARRLMTSVQQAWVQLRRGQPVPLPPPVEGYESRLTSPELAVLEQALSCSVVGSPDIIRQGLEDFVARTGADELMVVSQIYDHAARLRSYEIAAPTRQ